MRSKYILVKKIFIILVITCISAISSGQKTYEGKSNSSLLPFSELKYIDIGRAVKPGTETISKDEIQITAPGSDIWGKHDEFRFGYKVSTGDFDIMIRVVGVTPAHKYTKAGIMARTDLSDSSQHVFYQVFPDNSPRNKNNGGCEFQYRLIPGGDMKAIYPDPANSGDKFNVAYPNTWIRLKRLGDIFESYFSNDSKTWNLYSTFEMKLPPKLYVGLAVTSHDKNNYTTARFSSTNNLK